MKKEDSVHYEILAPIIQSPAAGMYNPAVSMPSARVVISSVYERSLRLCSFQVLGDESHTVTSFKYSSEKEPVRV